MKTESIGLLIRSLKQDFTRRVLEKLKGKGYNDLTEPNIHILGIIIRNNGIRLTQIAEILSISKQSVQEIISNLESKNYITRVQDPEDLRAKKVYLTELGEKMSKDGKKASEEVREEYISIVGKKEFEILEQSIKKIINH